MRNNPYLQLIRPANLITSATDIVAGATLATLLMQDSSTSASLSGVVLLIFASIFLYAGGIAFNDVFDLEIDREERPERPLPSGRISLSRAIVYSSLLLFIGIVFALGNHILSAFLAIAIGVFSLTYNKWSKHHGFAGPMNMGFLRGLNLLLGMSLVPEVVGQFYALAFIPWVYIFAITMVSRGEVHGGSIRSLMWALGLFIIVDAAMLSIGFRYGKIWMPTLFALLHLLFILPPLFKAIQDPGPGFIRKTVKHGVLGIIIVDALWVSMTEFWYLTFALLLLLPLSQKLARYFSVT